MTNRSQNHEEKLFEYIPLKVSAGVLLQIGAGIYSSVAAAFKELVSNAFDADASELTISTDVPRFEEMKIVDDGPG
ncbi:MAG: ATP-binding protein [Ardenticatenaceae bacterium]